MAQEKVTVVEAILFSGLAGVGGVLSYCLRQANKGKRPTLGLALLEGCSSAFVGFLAMLMCKATGLDWYWSGVVVGVFGWLGANASIAVLAKVVYGKIGVKGKTDDTNKPS